MTEKVFRVICSNDESLTADTIALALLKQVTLKSPGSNTVFGVMEIEKESKKNYQPVEYAASSNLLV